MSDSLAEQLAGSRLVAVVLRDMLTDERARSDRYRDALVRIGTLEGEDVIGDVRRIAQEAIGAER